MARDPIKEIAELHPLGSAGNCHFCGEYGDYKMYPMDHSSDLHSDDCLWVWCREQVKARQHEKVIELTKQVCEDYKDAWKALADGDYRRYATDDERTGDEE